jgi:hypothetical protein
MYGEGSLGFSRHVELGMWRRIGYGILFFSLVLLSITIAVYNDALLDEPPQPPWRTPMPTILQKTLVTLALTCAASLCSAAQATTYLRTVHALASGPALDIYFDDVLVDQKLEFMGISPFRAASSTLHTVRVAIAGEKTVILETEVEMADDFGYTLELVSSGDGMDSNLVAFNFTDLEEDTALISVYHMVQVEGSIHVKPARKPNIFEDVSFLDASTTTVFPFKATLSLNDANKRTELFKSAEFNFAAHKMYSLFAFSAPTPKGFELKVVEDVLP